MIERPIIMTAPSVVATFEHRKTQTRRLVNLERLSVRVPRAITGEARPPFTLPAGTHRVRLNPQGAVVTVAHNFGLKPDEFHFVCPYTVGTTALEGGWRIDPSERSILWVKETWCLASEDAAGDELSSDAEAWRPRGPDTYPDNTIHHVAYYAATDPDIVNVHDEARSPWKSPIFMPRWACRLTLTVVDVRLQRLQAITDEEARAEGVTFTDFGKHEHHLSADGGKTWGIMHQQRAGWHFHPVTSHEQCLGSPVMAYANAWNRLHAGDRWNLKDGPSPWDENPWVWAIRYIPNLKVP